MLPLSMPCCTSWNQAFSLRQAAEGVTFQARTSLHEKYDNDISNVCSSRTEHIATATKSLAQIFVICDNRAQRFIPPGVTVFFLVYHVDFLSTAVGQGHQRVVADGSSASMRERITESELNERPSLCKNTLRKSYWGAREAEALPDEQRF